MLVLDTDLLDVAIASGSPSERNLAIAVTLKLWLIQKYLRTTNSEPLYIKMAAAMNFDLREN